MFSGARGLSSLLAAKADNWANPYIKEEEEEEEELWNVCYEMMDQLQVAAVSLFLSMAYILSLSLSLFPSFSLIYSL
jgi:hypothetical protein